MSARTSSSRGVSAASFALVVARGPLGRSRTPSPRSSRATTVASERPPSRCSSACACRSASTSPVCESASAASRASSFASIPRLPASSGRRARARTGFPTRRRLDLEPGEAPPERSRDAASPSLSSTETETISAVAGRRRGRRSSQAISAPAAAMSTWAKRSSIGTPTAAACASASPAPGSPRRADEGEHAERLVVRPRRLPWVVDDRHGVANGVVPTAAVEGPAGGDRLNVDAPQVLRVLGAVPDRVVDVPLGEVVAVERDGTVDEGIHPPCRDLVLAVPARRLDGLLDHSQARLEVAASGCGADGDASVTGDELVAEARAHLERAAGVLESHIELPPIQRLHGLRVEDVGVLVLLGKAGGELGCAFDGRVRLARCGRGTACSRRAP